MATSGFAPLSMLTDAAASRIILALNAHPGARAPSLRVSDVLATLRCIRTEGHYFAISVSFKDTALVAIPLRGVVDGEPIALAVMGTVGAMRA